MNGVRGEASIEISGQSYPLCLTLGALAEIETALGCASLQELQSRLKALSARDIAVLLEALLRGGGAEDVRAASAPPNAAAAAVARALSAGLGL